MLSWCLVFLVLTSVLAENVRKPMYKYRYQTEDLMKTAESSIPVRGYHVVEGGYYPESDFGEYSGGYDGVGSSGYAGGGHFGRQFIGGPGRLGGIGHGGGYIDGGIGPAGYIGHGGYVGGGIGPGGYIGGGVSPLYNHHGGGYIDQSGYSKENKNLNDAKFEKAGGQKGQEVSRGQEGYSQDKEAVKNNKGDAGYYKEEQGGKKSSEDGKSYQGSQHFDQQGKNGAENKEKSNHKKGHVVKGFKTSHHKDESGKTEEYYDEEHDEGGKYNYNGKGGSFGEKAQSEFKGGHDNGQFNAGESKKEGHYNQQHLVDKSNGDQGHFGEKKYSTGGEVYGINNGIDQQSLLGHQEANRIYKHFPHHTPFYATY